MGQALPKDKDSGWAGACPEKRVGKRTSPRSWPPAKAWKGEKPGTPASFWGLAGAPAHPSVAPGDHQVTRILCFGMTLGVKARMKGRGGVTKVLVL